MKPVWCVMGADKLWCATKNNKKPDPDACNDPTECNCFIVLRVDSCKTIPTCPDCLEALEKKS